MGGEARHVLLPQDDGHVAPRVDDGRLDADRAPAAVDDRVDAPTEVREHVGGGGR